MIFKFNSEQGFATRADEENLELGKLKLEMQLTKIGKRNLDEEREVERKVKRTKESSDVHSQSANSRDESSFNRISEKKMSQLGSVESTNF